MGIDTETDYLIQLIFLMHVLWTCNYLCPAIPQLEIHKQELDEMKANQTKMKLSINSQLSVQQKKQEVVQNRNQEKEQKASMNKVDMRNQVSLQPNNQ